MLIVSGVLFVVRCSLRVAFNCLLLSVNRSMCVCLCVRLFVACCLLFDCRALAVACRLLFDVCCSLFV